jgi:hypothetical protein
MKRVFILAVLCLVFSACKKDATAPKVEAKDSVANCAKPKKEFKMYEMSELALLMEQMYKENEQLKARIIKGDTLGKFPEHILKIRTAVMTDESDRDAFFNENAEGFIKAQQNVYNGTADAKQRFNEGVDACLKCHEGKCGGPIPRIMKLYIK